MNDDDLGFIARGSSYEMFVHFVLFALNIFVQFRFTVA